MTTATITHSSARTRANPGGLKKRRGREKRRGPARSGAGATSPAFVALGIVLAALISFGLVMVLSASSVAGLRDAGDPWILFKKQLVGVFLGSIALVVCARIDYRKWRHAAGPALLISLALLTIVLVPGIGIKVSGSTRWLGFGPVRLQPSEFAKLALLVSLADLFTRRKDEMANSSRTLYPALISVGALIGLVALEPDMGTMLILAIITFAMLFAAGTPLLPIAKLSGYSLAGAVVFTLFEPYRRDRVLSFLHPFKDSGNTGYQVVQSLLGLGTGGIDGIGLGASRAKWGFLPNAHTDFIFAVIGEELGLIGAVGVLGLLAAFCILGARIALRAPDRFGMLLAIGITAWIAAQAIINIGAVVGMLPVTGVPLPFVSFGGSALVVLMSAAGVLLNVARNERASARRS